MRRLTVGLFRPLTLTFASVALVLVAVCGVSAQTCSLNGTVTLNFDSVTVVPGQFVDATSYLAGYGVTWSSTEAGAGPAIYNVTEAGSAITPTSPPNIFATNSAPGLNNADLTYTLSFCNPLTSVSFSAAGLVSTSTYPAWTATAYNAQGVQVGQSVGQPTWGFGTPAQTYTITGSGITSLTIASQNSAARTVTDPPIDSLTLVSETPGPTYSLSAGTASPVSVSPGNSSTSTVSVTPTNGYTGTVTLACSISPSVSGPTAPTCGFSNNTNPVTVTNAGGSATLAFATVGPSAVMFHYSRALYASWLPIPGLALMSLGLSSRGSRQKRLLGLLLLGMMLAGLIVLPDCGGSGGGDAGGSNGTPAGSYTITITGSDPNSMTQTGTGATVTVSVN
jgi:hypothetical protein